MKPFDRKTLELEDIWTSNEVGYKDSKLVTFYRKNKGASEILEHPDLKELVYLTVTYEPVTEKGFPSDSDYDLISRFEDVDIPKIELESNSLHVASVLKNGIYDFLFYVTDPESFLESYKANKLNLSSFQIELELASDPKWDVYSDFP